MNGSLLSARSIQGQRGQETREWSKLILGLAILVFAIGYVVRPESITNGRVGYLIIFDIQTCNSFESWLALDFPSRVYATIAYVLPFDPTSLNAWDALIALVGGMILLSMLSFFTGKEDYTIVQAGLVLAAVALCGVYIFMLNKDFLQFLVFLTAFGFIISRMSFRGKMASCTTLFVLEFLLWRQYYIIVAVFLAGLYFALKYACLKTISVRSRIVTFLALAIAGMFMFSMVLFVASPDNYAAVVGKHGVDREEYTVMAAASGIASLINVTPSSPPYLFVANWVVNTVRLLFPMELFLKGPYYAVFAVYQLCISFFAFRALSRAKETNREAMLAVALYFAFVLASSTFEPDFGSWVRHETACLPVILLVVSVSRNGSLAGLAKRGKRIERHA